MEENTSGRGPWAPARLLAVLAGLGALGGLGLGWWLWILIQAQPVPDPSADPSTIPVPDWAGSWPGGALGALTGAVLVLLIGRLVQGAAARSSVLVARDKAARAGLVLPLAKLSVLKPNASEMALTDMVQSVVFQAQAARKEKDKFQDALGKYADPTLSSRLKESVNVAGVGTQKLRCAILFCDIRGFTKMSETLKVEEVVYVLNDYFSVGSQVIAEHRGQINKFIGDAILAVFQDPPGYMTGSTACRNAVSAGMDLVTAFRRQRGVWASKISTPFDTDLGVGVHFGELIMGNFGSPQRMEYTVIGDTVNFASRLCSLAQKGQVKASDECWHNAEGYFTADAQEPVAVKGKAGLHQTWLLTGKKAGA